jgi:hypothetical protein
MIANLKKKNLMSKIIGLEIPKEKSTLNFFL